MIGGSQDPRSGVRDRILLVLPWELRPIGGVDGVVANLYEQFASHGCWHPLLLIYSWRHQRLTFAKESGYETIRMRVRGPLDGNKTSLSLLKWFLSLPRELGKVARIVRTFRVSVVNAHYPTLGMVTVALARRMGLANTQLVLSLHGDDIRGAASGSPAQRFVWRWLLRQADVVVAVSEGLARLAVEFEPRIQPRLKVVHNGIDARGFAASAEEADARLPDLSGRRVLLSVGAFEHRKGHDVLLRAFANLSSRWPDLHLVLVGQVAHAIEDIRSLIERLGLEHRVSILTDVPRQTVAQCMRSATVFALPTRYEPFGLVFLEAGACGVPVVATRVGGIPEIIPSPEFGILVEPDDPEGLASAIDRLLREPEAAARMGERLRERVRSAFSWEQVYEKYERLLAGQNEDGARKRCI